MSLNLVKFSIFTLVFLLGIFYSFGMMGERSRECDELLWDAGFKGIEKFHNICTNPTAIKSDIQTQLLAWAAEFNVSTKFQTCSNWHQEVLTNITNYANNNFKGSLFDLVNNLVTILSDNTKTRVHECNATFALLEAASPRPESNKTMRHEHMSCMHPPPSSSVCTLYPQECYHGRVPFPIDNNRGGEMHDNREGGTEHVNFQHVPKNENEGGYGNNNNQS
ncbi:unnamed protein product [Meloidogyne enterolobii]|uniref:Uncharacterized protein n=1 Tax=Meloidogyne enterolobii TaxID=390850 RepID=A0ACB0XTD3_MELEN